MLTAALAAKLIRQILVDYNFWPESEFDSPLRVVRSKTALTDAAILSRDASMRKTAVGDVTPAYKAPDRRIECKSRLVFVLQMDIGLTIQSREYPVI